VAALKYRFTSTVNRGGLMGAWLRPTKRRLRLLEQLLERGLERGRAALVFTAEVSQGELARELGVSRQTVNVHLRRLREGGYVRTGRGFIDLTEKALELLGVRTGEVFVLVKTEPGLRPQAYSEIKKLPAERIYRVAGGFDLIAVVNQAKLGEFLREISKVGGVKETVTYVIIKTLK